MKTRLCSFAAMLVVSSVSLRSGAQAPPQGPPPPPPFTDVAQIGGGAAGLIATNIAGPRSYTVTGGGNDIGGTNDEFTFQFLTANAGPDLTLDFRTRISSLEPNSAWTKAGLMVRGGALMTSTDRMVYCYVTPTGPTFDGGTGAASFVFGYRTNFGGAAYEISTNSSATYPRPVFPNNYVRVAGLYYGSGNSTNTLAAYSSVDGTNWYVLGSIPWSTIGNAMNFGLAVSRGSNGVLPTANAEYRSFTNSSIGNPVFLSAIPDQTTDENTNSSVLRFLLTDNNIPVSSTNWSVTSSDPTVLPNDASHIIVGGGWPLYTLTLAPAANAYGSTIVTIVAKNQNSTVRQSFLFTVRFVNQPPTISGLNNVTTNENSPTISVPFTVADDTTPPANLVSSLSAASTNATLLPTNSIFFASGGGGQPILQLNPITNQFGTSLVTVTVTDTNGVNAAASFLLTVSPVNQRPALGLAAQNLGGNLSVINLVTNYPQQFVLVTNVVPGPPNEYYQYTNAAFGVVVTSNSNPSLLAGVSTSNSINAPGYPTNWSLSFTPVPGHSGTNFLTVTANDGMASNNTAAVVLQVNVHNTNWLPTLSISTNTIAVFENVPRQVTLTFWDSETPVTNIQLSASSSDTTIIRPSDIAFSATQIVFTNGQVSGQSTANLTPIQDAFGTNPVTITFAVTDSDGGTAQSALSYTVQFTNHPPTLDPPRNVNVVQDSGPQVKALTGISPGPANEHQTASVTISNSNANLFSAGPTLAYTPGGTSAQISFTPRPNTLGSSLIYVQVNDGTPFDNSSLQRAFRVTVISSNDIARIAEGTADFINQLYVPAPTNSPNPYRQQAPAVAFFSGANAKCAPPSGNLQPLFLPPLGLGPNDVTVIDVSGDGWPDLISANGNYGGSLAVLTNDHRGGFGLASSNFVGTTPQFVTAADIYRSGKPALICADFLTNTVTIFSNIGGGNFSFVTNLPVGPQPFSVAVADVNGDGSLDLITANSGTNTVSVLTNNGHGNFALFATIPAGFSPQSVIATDLNGDGIPDLVSAIYAANKLDVWLNDGHGGFSLKNLATGPSSNPRWVVAADVNGDGAPDLISANHTSSSLSIFLNDGHGHFGSPSTVSVGDGPYSVTAGDVNGDGTVDLISANYTDGTLSLLTNDGLGNFALSATLNSVGSIKSVVAADVNGDGGSDLICASDLSVLMLTNAPARKPFIAASGFGQSFQSYPLGLPYVQLGGVIDPPPGFSPFPVSYNPDLSAFFAGGNLYASQSGLLEVTWTNSAGSVLTTRYLILDTPTSDLEPATMYLTDINQTNTGAPSVAVTNLTIIPHYNSLITTNTLGLVPMPGGVQLRATNTSGSIVLEYRDAAGTTFSNVQVLVIRSGPDNTPTNDVGTWLAPVKSHTNGFRPFVSRGLTAGSNGYYAFQYDVGPSDTNSGRVFATQATPDAKQIEVFWFKQSYANIVWPDEMDHYRAKWPDGWSNNAVRFYLTRTDDGAPTTAPGVDVPTLSVPNLTIHYNTNIPSSWIFAGTNSKTFWLESGSRNLQATHFTGPILLHYDNSPLPGFIGFELVNVMPYSPDFLINTNIGMQMRPIQATNDVANGQPKPFVSRGATPDDPAYLYQHTSPDSTIPSSQEGFIFAIRKTTTTNQVEVFWKRRGLQALEWPCEMDRYLLDWPSNQPSLYQTFVRGPMTNLGVSVRVPAGKNAELMPYQFPTNHAFFLGNTFYTKTPGWSLLKYTPTNDVEFQVVLAVDHRDSATRYQASLPVYQGQFGATIGTDITETNHQGPGPGFIWVPNDGSRHAWDRYDWEIYDGKTNDPAEFHTSQIIPVNTGSLEVWWYNTNKGVSWPSFVKTYSSAWPGSATPLVIASRMGSGPIDGSKQNYRLYYQNDRTLAGFNPNEEHAMILPSFNASGQSVFALRNDLGPEASEPYVLLKFQGASTNWIYQLYHVLAQGLSWDNTNYTFHYPLEAGLLIQQPYPLTILDLPPSPQTTNFSGPAYRDRNGFFWAKAAGNDGGTSDIVMRYFYPVQAGFYFPSNYFATLAQLGLPGVNLPPVGTRVPWLDLADLGAAGIPHNITNQIFWPPTVPQLSVAETLVKSKKGLPEIGSMISAQILYQQATALDSNKFSVQLIDPTRFVTNRAPSSLLNISWKVPIANDNGLIYFPSLPPHLRTRFWYDPASTNLNFKGQFVDSNGIQEPKGYLLLNVISMRDKTNYLDGLSDDPAFKTALNGLFANASNVISIVSEQPFDSLALTAGNASGTGYVTVVENYSTNLNHPADPIALHILQVTCPFYIGDIKPIESDNPFDEKLTLRNTGDFAGKADKYNFEWYYCADNNGQASAPIPTGTIDPPPNSTNGTWIPFGNTNNPGALDITIQGPGLVTLQDNWFICRYTPIVSSNSPIPCGTVGSQWTAPMLAEGWIKRVLEKINPFEQRIMNYQNTPVNTVVSMISQAGPRWIGDMPFNANAVNNFGLIEAYETVLRRGMDLSINAGFNDVGGDKALLLAAGRLADLYMLLGNEAYADAADPSIGFGTDDKQYGLQSTSIHCFMNQTASLLDEELALLRGRDDSAGGFSIQAYPVYNRLYWNFTHDINGGEVAYALNYNIQGTNGGVSGVIDEQAAKTLYPQGHGDAWGHYLSAIKNYYRLLTHTNYTWTPQVEAVIVNDQPVDVDYLDERKFAKAAAAKAQAGAEVVNLTYRQSFVEDQDNPWLDVSDTYTTTNNGTRAWSVGEWASRAGQGALFDWVVGNALIPPVSGNTGIQKIDRSTVVELRDIISAYNQIETRLDNADTGLNPLGSAQNAIPFDIDPSALTQNQGQTHFEQIYGRATLALNNALTTFNNAVASTQNLRRQADTLNDFQKTVLNQEVDFTNRLIESFGYPFPQDIGPGGSYPSGYQGPDLVYPHYLYIDGQDLTGILPPAATTVTQQFFSMDVQPSGVITNSTNAVSISLSTEDLTFTKPPGWTQRRAPGEIQRSLGELAQARNRFLKGLQDYNNLLSQIDDQAGVLKEQYNVDAAEITLLNQAAGIQKDLNSQILASRASQASLRTTAQIVLAIADAGAEALPHVVGFSDDPSSAVRGAIKLDGALQAQAYSITADGLALGEQELQQAKEEEQTANNIELTTLRQGPGITTQIAQLKQLVRQEPGMRYDLFNSRQAMLEAAGAFQDTLAKAQRVLDDRLRFRQQTASQIQSYRYKDMAFRIFRNDAVQKYWAQFDLAARYVYLAAKSYDFETCLLPWDSRGPGQDFLTEIIKSQDLGLFVNGQPVTASGLGLSDSMAKMWQNWTLVLKGQLGFNNPETETDRFSVRTELFRTQLSTNGTSKSVWTNTLWMHVVTNILTMPEFVRYCIPFEGSNVPPSGEPGIVIEFPSTVTFAENFFGWPLGGNDSTYDSSHFATKIRGVGVWFANYDSLSLSLTPRVYLIPAGNDVLRSPSGNLGTTREFSVVDQLLPVPYVNPNAMQDPNWIPINDTLGGNLADIRKFGSFRAYHDGGFTTDQMTYSSRLIGRSVWNRRWMLIIPAGSLLNDRWKAISTFINGASGDGNGVSDIKLFFQTYSYQGN